LPAGAPRPISIWQPQGREGELRFVRPEPLPLGDHYAAERVLSAAKPAGVRRICFFGESAAAGYLYAPHLTPARLLAAQLRAIAGDERYEIVDLARTNETLASLTTTIESALQLQPDLLVIFAGNNWNLLESPELSAYYPSAAGRRRYAESLETGGVAALVELAARKRLEKVGHALDRIATIAAASLPVVLVVPEVNLADWENVQPPTWLAGDGAAQWHRHYRAGKQALAANQPAATREAAQAMLALDEGTTPTPFRLVARLYASQGNQERARLAAEAEVDAVSYASLCFLAAPQATSLDKEVQRRAAAHYGFELVDLPAIFAAYTGDLLPGRRLFLDYCHLTAEAMQVAMAAVAAVVLRRLGDDRGEWSALAGRLPPPAVADEVEATARFGAAIHTAHRLLPVAGKQELLAYWCRAALDASPGVAAAMLDLVTMRAAPAPAVLTAAQGLNFTSPYRLLHQHGLAYDYLDADLIKAVTETLVERGHATRREIQERLLAYRALGRRPIDLLCPPYYLWEPLTRFYAELMERADIAGRATLRSPWPETSFALLADGAQAVSLLLTARLPAGPGPPANRPGTVRLHLNGQPGPSFELATTWQQHTVRLPRAMLRAGLNRMTFAWPELPAAGDRPLAGAVARLAQGLEADLHPVFGELAALRAVAD
jgi:hypothetical protein